VIFAAFFDVVLFDNHPLFALGGDLVSAFPEQARNSQLVDQKHVLLFAILLARLLASTAL
jgi:hypothetical protein